MKTIAIIIIVGVIVYKSLKALYTQLSEGNGCGDCSLNNDCKGKKCMTKLK